MKHPGHIHDSNLPMLAALLRGSGAVVYPMAVVEDEAAAMRWSLRRAAIDADLVLTTAGISVGDEDHVRDALLTLGSDLAVLKVAMKPGKPLAAGRLRGAVFVGLPGNPLAAAAGAIAFVRPLLARMGYRLISRPAWMTPLTAGERWRRALTVCPNRRAESGVRGDGRVEMPPPSGKPAARGPLDLMCGRRVDDLQADQIGYVAAACLIPWHHQAQRSIATAWPQLPRCVGISHQVGLVAEHRRDFSE